MPNHVTNRIIATGKAKDVAAFQDLMVVPHDIPWENPSFDFNRIIPRPPILDKVVSPARKGENGRTLLYEDAALFSGQREATEEEQKELDALLPYQDWYDWSVSNWGTKWNSYSFTEVDDIAQYEFKFDTAWSTPAPVMDELAQRFPHLKFDVAWFDEGWCHAGEGVMSALGPHTSMDELDCEPNADVYEKVYGEPPIMEEDYIDDAITERMMNNFSCDNVAEASDAKGYYPISATLYSDDPEMSDDALYVLRQSRDFIRDRIKS